MTRLPLINGLLFVFITLFTNTGMARSIYLNGTDISSAKSQDLKNVDIKIGENGDLYIHAPHYQVNEEDSYTPLSRYVSSINAPKHMPIGQSAGKAASVGNMAMSPKAGSKNQPPAIETPATAGKSPDTTVQEGQ